MCDFVICQVDAATVGRVAVESVPLAINDCIWDTGVAASESRTPVIRAGGTKVCECQVRKIKMARRVDACFGITPAKAGSDLSFKSQSADNPLEGLTTIERPPNPAGVGGLRPGRAGVKTVRIRRIDTQALLETDAANSADDR